MAPNAHEEETAQVNIQVFAGRLRPAEVHNIMRQQWERLAVSWNLDPSDFHRLTQEMTVQAYAPGETILPYGERADFVGLIVRGQIAVLAGQQDTTRPVAVLLPGITFGDLVPGDDRPSDAALQALTRSEVWFLYRKNLQALASEGGTQQRPKAFWGLLAWSAAALVLCLLVIVALNLPSVSQAAALVPMGLGQWCSQQGSANVGSAGYDHCVELAWKTAADLAPDDANPLLALGTFYFDQGDLQASEEAFEQARALVPDLAEAQNNLGVIFAKQGRHEEAISAFERALELEPGVAAVEHNLGLSLQAQGAYAEALTHHELALAFGEPQASTLANLAISYYETGDLDKAGETARNALQLDDSSAPAYAVLGALALESRQPKAALNHLRQAVEADEDYGRAHFYLGLVYKALEQPTEAVAAFEHALANTDGEEARAQIQQQLMELYQAEQDRSAD